MIPHALPMRFSLIDGRVLLPAVHPLCADGIYPVAALIELAAQAAGLAIAEEFMREARNAGEPSRRHAGMLVEVEGCTFFRAVVPAGEVLVVTPTCERVYGALRRYRVRIDGVLDAGLTVRVTGEG